MRRREVLQAMSGLLLAVFVAGLSGTIVANALPRIVSDLDGSQSQYTWIVTSTLLAATATGPIWGKLADRMSKKLLIQLSISIFVTGSVLAGLSPTTEILIGFRVLQGLGVGGLLGLVQIVIASIISPRERGQYMGYFATVTAIATIAGPPVGGLLVDVRLWGWRWCFWVAVPIALVALLLLQKTLRLPVAAIHTELDWRGALLIPGGISTLLIWLSLAGSSFSWASWPSIAFVAASVMLIVLAMMAEQRVSDPVVPPRLVRQRTMVLAIVASVAVGVTMVSASVFFAQYFQIARGYTPAQSGLLTLPMVLGTVVATTVSGRMVTRTGRWKRYLVAGTAMIVAGLALLGTLDRSTSVVLVGVYMAILGVGMGGSMPHLPVVVQNNLDYRDLGAGTAMLAFFRSLGGAAGVSALGAVFATYVADLIADGFESMPGTHPPVQDRGNSPADLSNLSGQARTVVERAYSDATALTFVIAAAIALVAFVAVLFIREAPLHTTVGDMAQEMD